LWLNIRIFVLISRDTPYSYDLLGSATFRNYPLKGTIFEKKKCTSREVSWFFSTTSLIFWNFSHSTKNSARYYYKRPKVLHVFKCLMFLVDFNKTWISSTCFNKIPQYKITWKSAQWESRCSMRKDRKTDGQI
jgi:hypothetical protein